MMMRISSSPSQTRKTSLCGAAPAPGRRRATQATGGHTHGPTRSPAGTIILEARKGKLCIPNTRRFPACPTGFRVERDSLGEVHVPADALYGAQTQRAFENFPISGQRFGRRFIQALGLIKKSAARVNRELGYLEGHTARAIAEAAAEVARGDRDGEFVLDVYQTGSGTSSNMNANEVIAALANGILEGSGDSGAHRGDRVHPNDHVNFGQSSNDVIPTAIHVSARTAIEEELIPALDHLRALLAAKAEAFDGVLKSGRTHLMDATPVRLGQEFGGYAMQITRAIGRLRHASAELAELALGGTATGTGINTHPDFARLTIEHVSRETGLAFREAENHFAAQGSQDACVSASGALNAAASGLMKIADDIRWLSSGPTSGIHEIRLPAVQPGSSIMPGKVNPVMSEALMMVAARVAGNHTTVTIAGSRGNFELNVMLPVIAHSLLESITLLAGGEPRLRGPVRGRHRGQPGAGARTARPESRDRDRAQPLHRLRCRRQGGQAGRPRGEGGTRCSARSGSARRGDAGGGAGRARNDRARAAREGVTGRHLSRPAVTPFAEDRRGTEYSRSGIRWLAEDRCGSIFPIGNEAAHRRPHP